jgi:hypothetical protein
MIILSNPEIKMLFQSSIIGKKQKHSNMSDVSFLNILKWHCKYFFDFKYLFNTSFSTLSICTSDRVVEKNGKIISRVLGDSLDNDENLHIEVCKLDSHSELIHKKNVISGSIFILWYALSSPFIFFHLLRYANKDLFIKKHIFKYLSNYVLAKYAFKSIKKVYIVNGVPYYGLIRGFKERGVEVIELQHGIIHNKHHGYFNKWVNSYSLPDELITFDKITYDLMIKSSYSNYVKIKYSQIDNLLSNYKKTSKQFDFAIIDTDPHRKELIQYANLLSIKGFKVIYCLKNENEIDSLYEQVEKSIANTYNSILNSNLVLGTTSTIILECYNNNVPVKVFDTHSKDFWLNYGFKIEIFKSK